MQKRFEGKVGIVAGGGKGIEKTKRTIEKKQMPDKLHYTITINPRPAGFFVCKKLQSVTITAGITVVIET